MRAVVQRAARGAVAVDGEPTRTIGRGLVVLLGVAPGDGETEARWMAEKIANLRIFPDDEGRMNRSLLDVQGDVLLISQFTLYGDARKGRRPSFVGAAPPEVADPLYRRTAGMLEELGVTVRTGTFGAHMRVTLENDGPVTILLDTPDPER